LVDLAREIAADLVVIGPEAAVEAGLGEALEAAGIPCFGPTAAAGRLESSKAFTKAFCERHHLPTSAYRICEDVEAAKAALAHFEPPYVIKADGLAAGKGVVIAADLRTAYAAIDDAFSGGFGEAGSTVVIEEYLEGEIGSLFALCDGRTAMLFGWAQDHKRAFDGEQGPNTGGMGAYSPAPVMTPEITTRAVREIIEPTVRGLKARGTPYQGVLYAGLMLTADGPKLIEYNARFGDPECQVLMPRLKSDLLTALLAARDGKLQPLEWRDEAALTVVMASNGYPGSYEKGHVITGLEEAAALPGVMVFHAGTERRGDDIVAVGGRVLNVTALGMDVAEARSRAYAAVEKIHWTGAVCRRDIGWRALNR
jgi:phosphoribosylamine--glycine ligase